MTLAMAYTLITITYGGEVNHSRGYETLRMCQEAQSLALTGMTIDENREADKAYAEREKERRERQRAQVEAAWLKDNPPRLPTDAEKADMANGKLEWTFDPYSAGETKGYKDGELGSSQIVALKKRSLGSDGLIHAEYAVVGAGSSGSGSMPFSPHLGEAVENVRGRWVLKNKYDIKSAHCVPETPDQPRNEKPRLGGAGRG